MTAAEIVSALHDRVDIAIAGGGMVGLSLAAALAELPLDVAVIEPVAARRRQPAELRRAHDRALRRQPARARGHRRLAGGRRAGDADPEDPRVGARRSSDSRASSAEEQGVAALGYTIENRLLGRALRERCAAIPRLTLCHAAVRRLSPGTRRGAS